MEDRDADLEIGPLEDADIIPLCFGCFAENTDAREDIGNKRECLYRCFPQIKELINVENLNELQNVQTLENYVHWAFARFEIAFRPMTIETPTRLSSFRDASQ